MSAQPAVLEGYQDPTHCWVPEGDADRSLLELAIEFNDMIGLPALAPWQIIVLGDWLATTPDERWLASEWTLIMPRQNGKSHLAILRMLFGLLVLQERHIVFTTHNFAVTKAIMDEMRKIIAASEKLTKALVLKLSNGYERIATKDGRGAIRFKARTKHGPRGLSRVDLLLYDEAFLLDYETHEAFSYTQAAAHDPQTLFLSSAGDIDSTLLKDRRRSLHEGESTVAGGHEWCAEEGDDYGNPDVWMKANPGVGYAMQYRRIAQEWETGKRNPKSFARERLGVWPSFSSTGKAINLEEFRACLDPDAPLPHFGAQIVFALDTEYDKSAASLAAAWVDAEGNNRVAVVRHTQRVEDIIEALPAVIEKVSWLNPPHQWSIHMRPSRDVREAFDRVYNDPRLQLVGSKALEQLTWAEYSSSCQTFASALRNKEVLVTPSASLENAVLDAIPKIDRDGGWMYNRGEDKAPNSSLVAVSMALWALRRKLAEAPPAPVMF